MRQSLLLLMLLGIAAAAAAQGVPEPPPAPPLPSPPPAPIPLPGGAGEIDDAGCRLLGPFALFVQALMGVVVVGSLVYKRTREKPRRPWRVWMLDITKQMLGQVFVHSLNVFLSDWGSHQGEERENPCSLYVLNVAVDTTLGVFFIYATMRALTHILTDVLGVEGCVSGQYTSAPIVTTAPAAPPSTSGRPRLPRTRTRRRYSRRATQHAQRPRLAFWARQLGMYLLALLLMKIGVLLLFALFPFLISAGGALLDLFGEHKNAQVLFSMSLFPLVMNVLQFWLIDTLLRHNPHTSKYVGDADEEDALEHDGRASESTDYRGSVDYRASGEYRGSTSTEYADGALYRQGTASTAHLVGDASESEGEEETPRGAVAKTRRAEGGAADDSHAYPPSIGSRSRPSSPPAAAAGQRASASSLDDLRVQASRTLSDEGEDEAWDAWDDEADSGGGAAKKAHARGDSAGSIGLEAPRKPDVKRD